MGEIEFYKNFNDEQIDAIKRRDEIYVKYTAFRKTHQYLVECLGLTHKITTDFRLKFLVPTGKEENEAQEIVAQLGVGNICLKLYKESFHDNIP